MSRQSIYLFTLFASLLLYSGCSSDDSSSGTQSAPDEYEYVQPEDDSDTNTTLDENRSMHFVVTVPAITPADEFICLGFDDGRLPLMMQERTTGIWELTTEITTPIPYRYCRNCECQAADEFFETTEKGWRTVTVVPGGTINDTVEKWRWWTPELLALDINTTGYVTTAPSNLPRSDFMTGVMFNDYWNDEWNLSIISTMAHLKAESNASWIEYAPVNNISQFYPTPVIEFDGANGTSQAQLEAIIDAAHNEGFKVFINPIPWGLYVTDTSTGDHNSSWWQAFHDQWREIMLQYVDIANAKGVEMLAYKMWPSIDELNATEALNMDTLALDLLHVIDGNYSGKIAVQAVCYDEDLPDLSVYDDNATDYLMMNIWSYYPWALAKDANDIVNPDANVTEIRQNFAYHLDSGSYGSIEAFSLNHSSKPIIFSQISPLSYDGAIVAPADNDELLDAFHINDDSLYVMDLQEQADVLEAILAKSTARPYIQGGFVFTYLYWNSIDKSINVRGKPSEKVMRKWFGWSQP